MTEYIFFQYGGIAMQIAIMGFGTIGSGVAELLLKNQKSIVAKSGQAALDIKYILDI